MLLEGHLTGLGTTDGGRRVFLNLQQIDSHSNVDLTGMTLGTSYVGNSWGEPRTFTGIVDWDDVVISTEPIPDQVFAGPNGTPRAGDCLTLTSTLFSQVTRLRADAIYDMNVFFVTDAGTNHAAADCSDAPISGTLIPAGQFEAQTFFKAGASSGAALFAVFHPDLFGTTLQFTILPALPDAGTDAGVSDGGAADGGLSDGGAAVDAGDVDVGGGAGTDGGEQDAGVVPSAPYQLGVGCGCAAVPPAALFGLVLVAFAARRGRRTRP